MSYYNKKLSLLMDCKIQNKIKSFACGHWPAYFKCWTCSAYGKMQCKTYCIAMKTMVKIPMYISACKTLFEN